MNKTIWVTTKDGYLGYVIEYKADKVKLQITDSYGFKHWKYKLPNWYEQSEVTETTAPLLSEFDVVHYY